MNPETKLQRRIMLAVSQAGYTVWRNETGQYWTGRVVERQGTRVVLEDARMVPCGLCPGSSDLIGIGHGGRIVAPEVKTDRGRLSTKQKNFLNHVEDRGGVAGVVRSEAEAIALFQRSRR